MLAFDDGELAMPSDAAIGDPTSPLAPPARLPGMGKPAADDDGAADEGAAAASAAAGVPMVPPSSESSAA
eukprot:2475822-Pyramimonas_sp.AAC.1